MITTVDTIRASAAGYQAGFDGAPRVNPHAPTTAESKAWEAGYEQGAQVRRQFKRGA